MWLKFCDRAIRQKGSIDRVIYVYIYIYIYIYVCVCVCVCVCFTNPSAWAWCETKSIFKWSLTGMNLKFSFFQAGCHIKVKEPNLLYYSTLRWRKNNWIHTFPQVYKRYVRWKLSRPGFELWSLCPFPTTKTVTLWTLPYIYIYIYN